MRRAFTLVELLVSVCIMGCLAGLLLPAVQASRESAREAECRSNLHQFGIEIEQGTDSHGILPWLDFDLKCPTYAHQSPPLPGSGYLQIEGGERHDQIVYRLELPSERIDLVSDKAAIHRDRQLVLYLDGHVE